MKFITNFEKDNLRFYEKAIALYGPDEFEIRNEAYDCCERLIPNDMSLHYLGTKPFDGKKFIELLDQFRITIENIQIVDKIEYDYSGYIAATLETLFDIEKVFGVTLEDDLRIDVYATYNPETKDLKISYFENTSNGSIEHEYVPAAFERRAVLTTMASACYAQTKLSLSEFFKIHKNTCES